MHEVAKAILLERGRLVLQLRDNKPSIETPGVWSLFGGIIEKNEDPNEAMIREIEEELCIKVKNISFLWDCTYLSEDGKEIPHKIFEADITSLWGKHRLMEGQAVESFHFDQLNTIKMPPFIQEVLTQCQRERLSQ